jgi:hypothetical protein
MVESSSMQDGAVWHLNRAMSVSFNHPIDPDTVHFGTIRFTTPIGDPPVTGFFEFEEGSNNQTLIFRPTCPTSADFDNGGFLPGGRAYTLEIPSSTNSAADVIRDTQGRPLNQGFSRRFSTPVSAGFDLFIDGAEGPPVVNSNQVEWPQGLNLLARPDPVLRFGFNQSIDARTTNLNLQNLYVLYANDVTGTAGEYDFPDQNRLPGRLEVEENCVENGATVVFQVTGPLPPERRLRLMVAAGFTDIVGQRTAQSTMVSEYLVPSLAEFYGDPNTDWQQTEVIDEIQEFFDNRLGLDTMAALPLPPATIGDGYVEAQFGFPGEISNKDFHLTQNTLEVFTTSQSVLSDSFSTTFILQNGVLNCRDFTIDAGATLRGRGLNPLVIYATGEVRIEGTLDVRGNDAAWPTGLNSPRRPEGGAHGECGGGDGGTSSLETDKETLRGQSGFGAWNFAAGGGQGGEGGINQVSGTNLNKFDDKEGVNNVVGGGGGGSFARTANVAVHWTRWKKSDRMSNIDNNFQPDHNLYWNPATNPRLSGVRYPYVVYGGEAGVRGASWNCIKVGTDKPQGSYGMEDLEVDYILFWQDGTSADGQPTSTPKFRIGQAWTDPLTEPNPFSNQAGETSVIDPYNQFGAGGRLTGHPTNGPDGGKAGASIFSNDGNLGNDFWGKRLNNDGSVSAGELLVPWAGTGGGASGDAVVMDRPTGELVTAAFPDPAFPNGTTARYRKGGPGGGGGGQLIIASIGDIILGDESLVTASGGHGVGAESTGWTKGTISGSGGGSGGHIVMATASSLDLSALEIGSGLGNGDQDWTIENGTDYQLPIAGMYFKDVVRAVGGRRGWSMARLNRTLNKTGSMIDDGNDTYAVGRGGAGGNGVIQIHVQDPAADILWPTSFDASIRDYLHRGNVVSGDLDRDRLEEILRVFIAPKPVVLLPLFGTKSMVRANWLDTGVAGLRKPAIAGNPDFPNYSSNVLRMMGFDPVDGLVETSNGAVPPLAAIATGPGNSLTLSSFEARIPTASSVFQAEPHFLLEPALLNGYEFVPDTSTGRRFEIVGASFDKQTDSLVLLVEAASGALPSFSTGTWLLRPRFFRIQTDGVVDSMPVSVAISIQFQGAQESAPGSNQPGTPFPGVNTWTSDLNDLQGYRYLRYQVLFDIDADNQGADLGSSSPRLDYMKIPVGW